MLAFSQSSHSSQSLNCVVVNLVFFALIRLTHLKGYDKIKEKPNCYSFLMKLKYYSWSCTIVPAPMDMIKTPLMLHRESEGPRSYKNELQCASQVQAI
ncbi:hypothetical protein Scep_005453 [Stephania cephalantha]|uniref:Uncharacterized protein n=1 Tax=Stephania cephalantha TaxID=152367 RepID=A0AAP0KXF1_9MAGN